MRGAGCAGAGHCERGAAVPRSPGDGGAEGLARGGSASHVDVFGLLGKRGCMAVVLSRMSHERSGRRTPDVRKAASNPTTMLSGSRVVQHCGISISAGTVRKQTSAPPAPSLVGERQLDERARVWMLGGW